MKIIKKSFLFICCCLILTACPVANKDSGLKKFKENHFDFSDFKRNYHKGIYFYLPDYFRQDYNQSYLYKKDGISLASYETGIFFSCERFDENEAEDYKFAFEDKKNSLDVVHAFYIEQRRNSMEDAKISLGHQVKQKNNSKAFYQIIDGSKYSYGTKLVYFIGTSEKKIKGKTFYYVFQMVSSKEMSAYLLNDFRKILSRVY